MKKSIISISFFLISALTFGQFISITPKVGLTYSTLRRFDMDYKPGFLLGISSVYNLSPKLSLKPEFLLEQKGFLQKGSTYFENGQSSTYKKYVTWNYLSLPLLLKYIPFENENVYLNIGGYAGYLVRMTESLKFKPDDGDNNYKIKKDISNFRRMDVGYCFGGGINIPFNENREIQLELRYNRSVEPEPNAFPTTHTFSFSLGYSFGIGKKLKI